MLVEDNAGWHRSKKVKIPEGIKVEFLPPYSPELQPAERLWKLVDEPLVNNCFDTIDESDAARSWGFPP
ncbi:transposase [Moorena sp. SIO3B2]|uniref:transposase n=1 Tax=Moorena sp. SIO3B2 TaxID=2607827 RepID=UPI00257F21C3|nr:transposase [Moorena sp. SIO3B2]